MKMRLQIAADDEVSPDIRIYHLTRVDGAELPPFTAGAHIDLHLPNGMVRSYSLMNSQSERHRYVIGVHRNDGGRGGSVYIHQMLRAGTAIEVSAPRNAFALCETAAHSVFIAGGIGITPIWSMMQRLSALAKPWELHYCARTRQHAILLDELEAVTRAHPGARVLTYFDSQQQPTLDIAALIGNIPADAHLYCCGPASMLGAFETAAQAHAPERVHLERFAGTPAPALAAGAYRVVLARSGASFIVESGSTILSTLLDHGLDVPFSCMQGICRACETRVLQGTPEHRDFVLSQSERASGKLMMICVSGCSGGNELVLDL